ncbi:hypothetical protein ES319_D03G008600v1 [Gossypium barbadense]|uniref:RING-type E3 ubiquitin transferase n=2 Tax=Gossypium TaxID=3633 RepID=A0A5J5RZ09_GOSBA|nr:hypothetical protein ES319_D03G008600v1 [Gossypium barbadense]TYG75180.1 hypothetical protein ES288_D03G009200v1 [Gossypium darwinii]
MREALFGIFSLLFIAYFSELASSNIVFKPLSISLPDLPAKFAIGNNTGVCGALEVADPLDACSPLRNDFGSNQSDSIRFALIIRGDCSFEEKIRNAQNKGFSAAIVYDDKYSNNLVYMMVNPKGIKVLAVFVSKSAGEFLKDHAKGENGECCIYPPLNGKAWTVFAILRRVDSKVVEALPCFVFGSARSSIAGETCAICLEDYNDGELLKVLPCQHVCRFLLAMAIPIRSVFLHPLSLQNHAQNIWETLMQPSGHCIRCHLSGIKLIRWHCGV